MTTAHSDRAARLVTRWVRCYTRRLPGTAAERRIEEIAADLHDHIAHEHALGTSDRRLALSILSRMVRGLPADAAWRRHARPERNRMIKSIVAALALIVLGVAAVRYGGIDDSPGLQLIGVLLVVIAVVISVRAVRRGRVAKR